jgi:hypothetical protein
MEEVRGCGKEIGIHGHPHEVRTPESGIQKFPTKILNSHCVYAISLSGVEISSSRAFQNTAA